MPRVNDPLPPLKHKPTKRSDGFVDGPDGKISTDDYKPAEPTYKAPP